MSGVNVITIYLGSKCNLNCAYCHREADKNETGVTDKLLRLLDEQKPREVRFFGGEPLLYMTDIKKVVKHCGGYVERFTVTTNGTLLAEHVEYFKKHHFKIVVSFDGNSKDDKRGFNPLTEIGDYPHVSISTTLYHGNTDFKQILRSFCEQEKETRRMLMFFPHICHHTSKKNEPYALTLEDVDNVLANYKYAIGKFWRDFTQYGVINMRYKSIFMQLLQAAMAGYEFGETYCSNRRCMKVNANGDEFNCLYVRNISASKNKKYMQESFPACAKCDYYFMCGGACVQSLSHAVECKLYYQLYDFFAHFFIEAEQEKLNQLWRILKNG